MGENGAGKSTLIKAITGAMPLSAAACCASTDRSCSSGRRTRPSRPVSARSTRRSTCCRTSRWPRTSHSAASRDGSASSTGREMRSRAQAVLADLGLDIDPAVAARPALPRHPAAGRDRACHLDRRQGPGAGRADLEPGHGRVRRAVPSDPRPQAAWRGDPVRLALPRPGLRDQRPHHGPAGRQARRRVPDPGAAAHRPGPGDARTQRRLAARQAPTARRRGVAAAAFPQRPRGERRRGHRRTRTST